MIRRALTFAAPIVATLALAPSTPHAAPADWPEFRGPGAQGHAGPGEYPLRWSEKTNVRWKTPIDGRGWSSPVIEGNRIWLTTAIESPLSNEERKKRLEDNTGSQPLSVSGPVTMRAVGIDRTTGAIALERELLVEKEPQPVHTLNSFASPTPVIEDGRLYCHFGSHGTACLDTKSGRVVWRNDEVDIAHENGPGSSPISWGDVIIVHCDGSDDQYVVAFDKKTGDIAWKTSRSGKMNDNPQLKKAYGTPIVASVAGRPQVLSPGANWLYAYDPKSGEELWRLSYGGLGFSIVPRPVLGHGMVYFSTSFMTAEILAVRYPDAPDAKPEIAWRTKRAAPKMPSPILVGDELYFVSDKGIAACVDAKTGKEHWRERLGGNYCASPLFASGRIYFFSREGTATVIRPETAFQKIAESRLDGSFMASPAAVGGVLYLRTDKALYRVEAEE